MVEPVHCSSQRPGAASIRAGRLPTGTLSDLPTWLAQRATSGPEISPLLQAAAHKVVTQVDMHST